MSKHDVQIANLSRDLAPASLRHQRAAISTGPWFFLKKIFFGIPVTFLFWHTYLVVNLTLNGGSIWAARGLLRKQSNCSVAGEWMNDE